MILPRPILIIAAVTTLLLTGLVAFAQTVSELQTRRMIALRRIGHEFEGYSFNIK